MQVGGLEITYSETTQNSGFYSQDWIFANVSCIGDDIDSVELVINGTNRTSDANSGGFYWLNATGLADGSYIYSAFCNDTFGNYSYAPEISVSLDTIAPQINFELPTPYDGFLEGNSDNNDLINVTCWDENGLPGVVPQGDNPQLIFGPSNTAYSPSYPGDSDYSFYWEFSGLENGYYPYHAICWDEAGNQNTTEERTLRVEYSIPVITVEQPTPIGANSTENTSFTINISASEDPGMVLSNLTITIYLGGLLFYNLTVNGTDAYLISTVTLTGLSDGRYYYNASANDDAGHSVQTALMSLLIDNSTPLVSLNPNSEIGIVYRNYAFINATCNESNIDSVLLFWNGSYVNFTQSENNHFWTTRNSLSLGSFTYRIFCNDSLGHNASTPDYTLIYSNPTPIPVGPQSSSSIIGGNPGAIEPVSKPVKSSPSPTIFTSPTKSIMPSAIPIKTSQNDSLFDVVVEIIKKVIAIGEQPMAKISLTKFNEKGTIDVNVYYEIRDVSGKVATSERESHRVDVTLDFIKALDLPASLPSGTYEYFAKITYGGGKTAESSDTFYYAGNASVLPETRKSLLDYWAYFLGVILSTSIIYVWNFWKGPGSFDAYKVAETVAKKADLEADFKKEAEKISRARPAKKRNRK